MTADGQAIDVRGLSLTLGGTAVLSDLALEVAAGERVGLTGANGAGKSTLLRCLAAWSSFDRGEVRVLGCRLPDEERLVRRGVVLVPDVPSFYLELTAFEHLRFIAQARNLAGAVEDGARLFEAFGLAHARDAYPSSYSRGMQIKLALILALVSRPRLLLLDEPWGAIDAESVAPVAAVLDERLGADGTLVVVSHVWPAGTGPRRVLRMAEGRLVPVAPS